MVEKRLVMRAINLGPVGSGATAPMINTLQTGDLNACATAADT
jgi:hypothetical protein